MTPMQSSTNKLTLVLLCCLAFAGFAGLGFCDGGYVGKRPMMQIQPPMAPVAQGAIPGQRLDEGATETLDVEPYFTDPDSDELTYSVEVVSGASAATVTVSGSVVTIRGLAAGTAEARVTATDPGGLTANQDFTVRVDAVTRIDPPVAPPVAPPMVNPPPPAHPEELRAFNDVNFNVGDVRNYNLDSYFTDPNGESLTYNVGVSSSSVGYSTSGSRMESLEITGDGLGTAVVTVTATAPGGLSVQQTFMVLVDMAGS